MVARARKHLESVRSCPHGSLSDAEMARRGFSRGEVIDFSASCNPLGTAPAVLAAMKEINLARYPDDQALELRRALARGLHLELEWVAVGNGSVDLMWQLATAYLDPGDRALVVGPTFGEYARACTVVGGVVEEVLAPEERQFGVDVEAVARAIRESRPKLAFLCNPNNPTGQLLSATAVEKILDECQDTLLVVDEAYLPFCDAPPDLLPHLPSGRLLLLRSMTKDHGLAGLRLGYAAARPDVIGWLDRVRPPWAVNALAQAAGIAALSERGHLERARQVVREARAFLEQQLSAVGLQVVPSAANFLLVRVGDGAGFRSALMARGICVRDCASFGLPAYIRIGVRTLPECERLVEAVLEAGPRWVGSGHGARPAGLGDQEVP